MIENMHAVNFEEGLDYTTLEKALLNAASDVGLKSIVVDKYDYNYTFQNGSFENVEEYTNTQICLSKNQTPVIDLYLGDKQLPIKMFHISRQFDNNITPLEEVENYLDVLIEYL